MSRHAAFRRAIPADARVSTWHAVDGWPIRRFDWPAAEKRGAILFQTGRGDVFEKYLEAFAHWHDAGWSVSAFDWRGQGGSGRLSADRNVGHADDFARWITDLADFWRSWVAEQTGPHVVVGHSMGGFLVLRALVDRVIEAGAAVLVAPMLGLRSPVGARAGGWLATLMRRAGDPARAAWKGHEKPGARIDRQSILTADADRYSDEDWWYARSPELRLGPPSWAWLAEAFAGTLALRCDPALVRMTTPTLMLLAEHDALVDAQAAAAIGARLPDAKVIRFGAEAAHELLREADLVRDRALAAIDVFLAERAPT
ncbi:lysophospholipase [Sphingomonas palmae]|uniref:Lysophospholipase n=1 Tax=Sphingomonas palmae TaxID=1855283 RepID=A0A1H7P4S8_9SPHN|nr:alpha/beta hydrolase [Sphingomonas palmae]SEL30900.1 lysophospholipase [Sphingomonas palmae]